MIDSFKTTRERLMSCEERLREAEATAASLQEYADRYLAIITPGGEGARWSQHTEWVLDRMAEELKLTPEQRADLSAKINPPIAFAGGA